MPKPQGTYLKIQAGKKAGMMAPGAKQTVALAKSEQVSKHSEKVFKLLQRIPKGKLNGIIKLLKDAAAKQKKLAKGEALTETGKIYTDALDLIGKVLKEVKQDRELRAEIGRPFETVVRAPTQLDGASNVLTLLIALVAVVKVLVQWQTDKGARMQ